MHRQAGSLSWRQSHGSFEHSWNSLSLFGHTGGSHLAVSCLVCTRELVQSFKTAFWNGWERAQHTPPSHHPFCTTAGWEYQCLVGVGRANHPGIQAIENRHVSTPRVPACRHMHPSKRCHSSSLGKHVAHTTDEPMVKLLAPLSVRSLTDSCGQCRWVAQPLLVPSTLDPRSAHSGLACGGRSAALTNTSLRFTLPARRARSAVLRRHRWHG